MGCHSSLFRGFCVSLFIYGGVNDIDGRFIFSGVEVSDIGSRNFGGAVVKNTFFGFITDVIGVIKIFDGILCVIGVIDICCGVIDIVFVFSKIGGGMSSVVCF